jgi:hypothetical protein
MVAEDRHTADSHDSRMLGFVVSIGGCREQHLQVKFLKKVD